MNEDRFNCEKQHYDVMSQADSTRLTLIFHAIHAVERFPFQLGDMRKRDMIIKPLAAE